MDGGGSNIVKVVEANSKPRVRFSDVGLRILGLALTLVAAIVAGVDKETAVVSFTLTKNLGAVHVPVTAKWQHMSSTVYFLVVNVIACSYAAASLIFSVAASRNFKDQTSSSLALVMFDLIMTALLFSAEGAAIGVGLISRNGNTHVQWHKVCNMFKGFCRQMTAAVIMSLFGSFVFLWLVALSILTLHKEGKRANGKSCWGY